ncbi:hypothetical protein AK88_05260 [Plasmodium fragile]|uniref:Schizont-infected cell agglutination C-terminal domain-containing protein n=1 Tax=Plasmodium fragile TaxID=5857 RepID=A0A0D9QDN0_PLAFR|nr:uncharacterized protein AK88_05260 [Plasmodium fragile]KJP85108.1 hypothetical protein AK88_05260 [Plasmodium fragile]
MNPNKILTEWKDYKRKGHPAGEWTRFREWLWQEIEPILQEFIAYMQQKDMWDVYGSNCNNHFYYHSGTGYEHHVKWPGTKVMCKIMSTALFFLTDTNGLLDFTRDADEPVQKLRQLIGCTIVNVFMHILEATVCEGHWGLEYAWYVMREKMEGTPTNIIKRKECVEGFIDNVNLGSWSMKAKIKEWIQKNTDLRTWAQDTEIKRMCPTAPEKSTEAQRTGKGEGKWQEGGPSTDTYGEQEVRAHMETGLKRVIGSGMHEIMTKVGEQLEAGSKPPNTGQPGTGARKPGSGTHAAAGPNAPPTTPGGAQQDSKKDTISEEDNTHAKDKPGNTEGAPAQGKTADGADTKTPKDKKSDSGSSGLEGTGGARAGSTKAKDTNSPNAAGSDDEGTGATQPGPQPPPQAPASPVPSSPPASITPQAEPAPAGGSAGTGSTGNIGCHDSGVTSSSVSVTCGTYTAPGLEAPRIPPGVAVIDEDANTGPGTGDTKDVTAPDHKNGVSQSPELTPGPGPSPASPEAQPALPAPPETPVETTTTTSTQTPSAAEPGAPGPPGPPGPSGQPGAAGETGEKGATGALGNSSADAVVDGGNDDPPPLNPPKPNPNPDQSGSGPGGTGAGGLPDGAGGGAGRGGGGGSGSSPSSTTSRATASNGDDKENNAADSKMQAENVGFELDLKPYKGGLDGSYAPPSPEVTASDKPVTIPGRSKDDDAISPIFTAKDIFLSSSVLIFVASVTSLIVLYSLWKKYCSIYNAASRHQITEVLHECEAAEWENVKDDYWQIVVQEFAPDLEQEEDTNNNILGVSTSHAALATHDSTTRAPPTDFDGTDPCPPHDPDPWSCMETIQSETDPCPPNAADPDACSCMETIQLDAPHSRAPTVPGDATSHCTHWINWIDRNKDILRECTGHTWFLQLKADWQQYLREHMVANEHNVVYGHRELGDAATMERKKLDLWKEWVAQQHALMHIYGAEEWFQHLLHTVAHETTEETGSQREQTFHANNIPTAQEGATDAAAQKRAPENIPLTKVKEPEQQHDHYPELRHTEHLTAHKLWMLVLSLLIEECDMEQNMKETELYVDDLLEQL